MTAAQLTPWHVVCMHDCCTVTFSHMSPKLRSRTDTETEQVSNRFQGRPRLDLQTSTTDTLQTLVEKKGLQLSKDTL